MKTKIGLYAYAILFGLCNLTVPLIRASTAKLLGEDAFSTAYGWILAANGVGLFIGPALAGIYLKKKGHFIRLIIYMLLYELIKLISALIPVSSSNKR